MKPSAKHVCVMGSNILENTELSANPGEEAF